MVPGLQESGLAPGFWWAQVQVTYNAETHEVRLKLPGNLDGSLFGEGEYTLGVLRGKLSRVKLNERDPETVQETELQNSAE